MRHLYLLVVLLFIASRAYSSAETGTLQQRLAVEFGRKAFYGQQKEYRISNLRARLALADAHNTDSLFALTLQLYEEYRSFRYDSARVYADRLYTLSLQTHNTVRQNYSKMKLAFILLSAGKYHEAIHVTDGIDHTHFDEAQLREYYSIMTRAWFDLAGYDNDQIYSPAYRRKGNTYLDSAISLTKQGTYDGLFLASYRNFINARNTEAIRDFLNLEANYKVTTHQDAITSSLLGELYLRTNQHEKATDYLIRAVIGDLQSATKETAAIFQLAELASKSGDVNNAYLYIQQALQDAEFYGARQRQIQITAVLPLIIAQKVNFIESEKKRFLVYLVSTLLLALLIVVISVLLYRQLKEVRAKEKIIEHTNARLETMNLELVEVNKQVVRANRQFAEDAHIKEEYIGYFFNVISGYILKLERLKTSVEAKITQNKADQILPLVQEIQIHKEREALFQTFDKVFLKIFPHFIASFNALFRKEDQIWPKPHELMTTDLRIFALTRLGMDDSESIAKILQYSAKTIYVYKMRLKAKSIYAADEFDERLMNIKAIEAPVRNDQEFEKLA